ncbi:Glycerol-3-phosphate dehydrogenase OS=Streptomyces albaduncus OX=68172 GN=FHS32_005424 PE=3 SV=1 [Streptomyces griseoloalbus]
MYVGLTDEPVDGDIPDVTEPPETDIGFLLDVLCSVLHVPVRRDDVVGAFAGLRPLLDTTPRHAGRPAPDRRHLPAARRADLAGRRRDGGGRQADHLPAHGGGRGRRGRTARGLAAGPSRTASLPLVGAAAPHVAGLPVPRRLVCRHGTEARRCLWPSGTPGG